MWILKKPSDMDLQCFLKNTIYPGSAGQGFKQQETIFSLYNDVESAY